MKDQAKTDRDQRDAKAGTSKPTATKRDTSKDAARAGAQKKPSPEMKRADVANGENQETGAGA